MSWPQIVVVALMATALLWLLIKDVRDRTLSDSKIVVRAWLYAIYCTAYAYVLHAGGFW